MSRRARAGDMPRTRASVAQGARESDSDAPEEVSGARTREEDAKRREDARAARAAAAAATRKRRESDERARREAREAREAVKMTSRSDVGGGSRAGGGDDELEELPREVIEAALRPSASGKKRAFDAFEAHVGMVKRAKRTKKERREAKRRAYEKEGFEVVALDGNEGVEGEAPAAPATATDFLRARLMQKHARSGEMLRDARTGKIPNVFARRR